MGRRGWSSTRRRSKAGGIRLPSSLGVVSLLTFYLYHVCSRPCAVDSFVELVYGLRGGRIS